MNTPKALRPAHAPSALDAQSPVRSTAGKEDHALAVLLEVCEHIAPELPEDLLRQCYAVQKQFQFDRDEQLPLVHTRRLIEGYVEREAEREAEGRDAGDA